MYIEKFSIYFGSLNFMFPFHLSSREIISKAFSKEKRRRRRKRNHLTALSLCTYRNISSRKKKKKLSPLLPFLLDFISSISIHYSVSVRAALEFSSVCILNFTVLFYCASQKNSLLFYKKIL